MSSFRASGASADAWKPDETSSVDASTGEYQYNGMDATQKEQVKEVEEIVKRETQKGLSSSSPPSWT
jgi:hypothetical protein